MDYIKEYIEELFLEEKENSYDDEFIKMKPVDDLALIIDPARHATTFILYNPKYYASIMKDDIKKSYSEFLNIPLRDEFNQFKNFYSFTNVQDVFIDTDGIYGYLCINRGRTIGMDGSCFDSNEIRSVAARNGYGMIMYLIALSLESPVMPNRSNISNASKKFWSYLDQQREKVTVDPFSNEDGLHKKTEKDCKVYNIRSLDQSYTLKKPIKLKGLVFRHKLFLEQMKVYFKTNGIDFIKTRVSEYILSSGKIFFDKSNKKRKSEIEN